MGRPRIAGPTEREAEGSCLGNFGILGGYRSAKAQERFAKMQFSLHG